MKLPEAKAQFIQNWGVLGSQWGISRTMAQIHALLLVSPEPLSADEIMQQLQISRGNANMNLRDLIGWGIIDKILKPGERREFFSAEKDIYKAAMSIIKERKRRELDPLLKALEDLKNIDGDPKDPEVKAFTESIEQIQRFAKHADKGLGGLVKAEEHWFTGTLLKLFK